MRPQILNGIEAFASRGDLLDRSLMVTLPAIPEDRRRTEQEFWSAFEKAQPRILGALFDAVVVALRRIDGIKLDRMPRMADLARWVVAAEPALPWKPGDFLSAYERNRKTANYDVLESDPVAVALLGLVGFGIWSGTATELLAALGLQTSDEARRQRSWPKTPRGLSSRLRRLAPNLRRACYSLTFSRQPGGGRRRSITVTWVGEGDRPDRPDRPELLDSAPGTVPSSACSRDGGGDAQLNLTLARPGENTRDSGRLDGRDARDASSAPSPDTDLESSE
jgi:hypothetical protein